MLGVFDLVGFLKIFLIKIKIENNQKIKIIKYRVENLILGKIKIRL